MNARMTRQYLFAGVACVLLWAAGTVGAPAHPILVPQPTKTLADKVLLSDSLVLAREDPQRPFHLAAVHAIKGDIEDASFDIFMPSMMRNKLALDPELTVLIGRGFSEEGWQPIGMATDDVLQVVDQVLSFSDEWTPGETDNFKRMQTFAPLLGHKDLSLHELAYVEVGRASYEAIRQVGAGVPMRRVRLMLNNPTYFEWRGLDIMLLGLSGEQQDHDRVVSNMRQMRQASGGRHLAAWATAYLEVVGPVGIDEIEEWYYLNTERSREELQAVSRALAGHANDDEALRDPVVAAYLVMLANHPNAAPDIAHDLIAWERWDLVERMQQLRPQIARDDPLGVYRVDNFLRQAQAQSATQPVLGASQAAPAGQSFLSQAPNAERSMEGHCSGEACGETGPARQGGFDPLNPSGATPGTGRPPVTTPPQDGEEDPDGDSGQADR